MLPRKLAELIREKDAMLLNAEATLGRRLSTYDRQLLDGLLRRLYERIELNASGHISNTLSNYRVLGEIDRLMNDVAAQNIERISLGMEKVFGKVHQQSNAYFQAVLGRTGMDRLARATEGANRRMGMRIGIVEGRLIRGGFIENVLNPSAAIADATAIVSRGLAAQMPMGDMVEQLGMALLGEGEWGVMERQFNSLAHDLYQQYDAAYGDAIAKEVKLDYFIYQGGIVEGSRDFCIERDGRVFHRDDTIDWGEWTPAKAKHLTEIKQKDPYKIPSYIDYAGYNPLIDRGGYNCRHKLAWITEELAKELGYEKD